MLTPACVIASGKHLLVQYAAPWEKNTEMSEPMSPAQSCSCASDAGRPLSSLAAHRAVAALALPPPSPAAAHATPLLPCTFLTSLLGRCSCPEIPERLNQALNINREVVAYRVARSSLGVSCSAALSPSGA